MSNTKNPKIMILPFNTIQGAQFPIPRTIVLAAISELRHSDKSDFEIANYVCECLGLLMSKNHLCVVQKETVATIPNVFYPLGFEKRDESIIAANTAL